MIEGDSLEVINVLSNGARSFASYGALVDSCNSFFQNLILWNDLAMHLLMRSPLVMYVLV